MCLLLLQTRVILILLSRRSPPEIHLILYRPVLKLTTHESVD